MCLLGGGGDEPPLERFHRGVRTSALHHPSLLESWALYPPAQVTTGIRWVRGTEETHNHLLGLELHHIPVTLHTSSGKMIETSIRVDLQPPLHEGLETGHPFFEKVSFWPRGEWMLTIGLAFIITWALLRVMITRLFSVPFPGPHSELLHLSSSSKDSEDRRNLLVLGPPGSGKSWFSQEHKTQGVCDIIDMRTIGIAEQWKDDKSRALASQKPIIILDHFGYAFGTQMYDQKSGI